MTTHRILYYPAKGEAIAHDVTAPSEAAAIAKLSKAMSVPKWTLQVKGGREDRDWNRRLHPDV